MAFAPVYEKISFNREEKSVTEKISVECKTDISAEEVKKVINAYAVAEVLDSKIEGGVVNYSGAINLFVCYENVEGVIRKNECVTELKGKLAVNDLCDNCVVDINATVEKLDLNLSGIKLATTLTISLCADITCAETAQALAGGEDIIAELTEINAVSSFGKKQTTYSIEEEFDLDYPVKEVLCHRAQSVITSSQCGVGCIIADGQVFLSLTLLKQGETTQIVKETKVFPFRVEIDCEEAMPACTAIASVKTKSFKTDITVLEGEENSTCQVNVSLLLFGEAFESKSISIASDAFCVAENLTLTKREFCMQNPCEVRSGYVKINGSSAGLELAENSTLTAITSEKVEIAQTEISEGVIKISGVLTAVAWLAGEENKIYTRKLETPFFAEVEANLEFECSYKVKAIAHSGSGKIISNNEIEFCAEAVITIYPCNQSKFCVISEVVSTGEKLTEKSAISVYIAVEGETLWGLAKRLNVCPEALVSANKELEFPLSGKERIVVYRG